MIDVFDTIVHRLDDIDSRLTAFEHHFRKSVIIDTVGCTSGHPGALFGFPDAILKLKTRNKIDGEFNRFIVKFDDDVDTRFWLYYFVPDLDQEFKTLPPLMKDVREFLVSFLPAVCMIACNMTSAHCMR